MSVVRGAVVEAATGQPLTRFEMAYLKVPPGDERHWVDITQSPHTAWIPKTDPRGEFELRDIASHAPFAIAARADGLEPVYVDVPALEPGASRDGLRLALIAAGRIEGRVTDAAGRPLASAALCVGEDINREPLAFTDPEGRYALKGLLAGPVTVWAAHGQFVPASHALTLRSGEVHEVDLALHSGVSILGHAWIGENPMGGLDIIAASEQGQPAKRAVTEHDGSYRIDGLAAGEIRVLAVAREWPGAVAKDAIPNAQQLLEIRGEEETVVDFHFPTTTSSIFGSVTVDGDVPAAGEVQGELLSADSQTHFRAVLDNTGQYRVDALLPGEAHIAVEITDGDGNIRRKLLDATIPEGDEIRLDVEFGGSARIHGSITGISSGEFAQVNLLKGAWTVDATDLQSLLNLETIQLAECPVGDDGGFEFKNLEPGDYTVIGFAVGFEPDNADRISAIRYVSETATVDTGGDVELDLVLEPDATS